MKNVQISQELFLMIFRYFELECLELEPEIRKQLNEKLDALVKHDLYTKYKNKALSDEEREQARKEYLDMVGIHPDWRW